MIKNIVFDWSGTLSDDFTPVYEATMLVMRFLINKTISKEEYMREFTLPYMDFWHKYVPNLTKEECDNLYLKAIGEVIKPLPYKDVKRTLEKIKSKGINMIVISSHPQDKLNQEVKEYGFQDYFQEVNGSVHDKREVILEILQRNNFDKKETIYVGDMTHDIDAGKKAGVITVALSWGYQSIERLMSSNPDNIFSNISSLDDLL